MDYYFIDLICITIHIVAICVLWRNWRGQSILHPGIYFSALWLISTISQWLACKFDIMPLPNEPAIYELNKYAAYTSIIFMIFSFIGKKNHIRRDTFKIVEGKLGFIKVLLIISFASTILSWIYSGASFNFNENRADIIDSQTHIGKSFTIVDSLLAICNSTLPFVTIAVGFYLGMLMATGKSKIEKKWIILPIIIAFIDAMSQGGRISVLNCIRNYIIGIGFSLPLFSIPKSKIIKLTVSFIIFAFIFLSFISIIGASRADYTGHEYSFARFGVFSGVVDYMTSHYWGFQLRRIDYANDIDLYYGINTFYGFLNFRIPFSASLGFDGNIWNIIGIDFDPLAIYKSGVEGSYTTSSQFMPLIADFGTTGAYYVIILLVYFTQKIFLSVIQKNKKTAVSLILYYMFFCYWFGSNFNNGFMSLYTLFLAALLFELVRIMCQKNLN